MTDINIGQISEALNDKMDRDGNNIESPRLPIFLVAKQDPTSSNSYTWYRKYSDGWVEQGGKIARTTTDTSTTITLPITMSDANYTCVVSTKADDSNDGITGRTYNLYKTLYTTYFQVRNSGWSTSYNGITGMWKVSGKAA